MQLVLEADVIVGGHTPARDPRCVEGLPYTAGQSLPELDAQHSLRDVAVFSMVLASRYHSQTQLAAQLTSSLYLEVWPIASEANKCSSNVLMSLSMSIHGSCCLHRQEVQAGEGQGP